MNAQIVRGGLAATALAVLTAIVGLVGCGPTAENAVPRLAIIQYVPTEQMERGVAGITEALAKAGYRDGETVSITRFDAQGDMGLLMGICQQVAAADYAVAVTVSTPALQGMANANRAGRLIHIFGLVTDPFSAGVGLQRDRPTQHPPHLAGIGTFEPVAESFRMARQVNPALRRVGVVYNAGEDCSLACLTIARTTAAQLGMTLEEMAIDNSALVGEATQALLERGVEAFWTGGDNTINNVFAVYAATARRRGVPVFSCNLAHVGLGSLFSYGADYHDVGLLIGDLAARALREPQSVAGMAITDVAPQRLAVTRDPFPELSPAWQAALVRLRTVEQQQPAR
ncbi:MAG TPA: ABC transporter substrate-binding protein [bacterium]|nr:ABC transporter substrate-binding protein [bacterium]